MCIRDSCSTIFQSLSDERNVSLLSKLLWALRQISLQETKGGTRPGCNTSDMIAPLKVFTQVYSEVSGFMDVLEYSATERVKSVQRSGSGY